jgi:hypothetical protein
MSQLTLGPSLDSKQSPPIVHLLPFHLAYSGLAAISRYFRIRRVSSSTADQQQDEGSASEAYETTFRGRLMHGAPIDLPEGYTGMVLHASTRAAQAVDGSDRRKRRRTMENRRLTRQKVDTEEGREDRSVEEAEYEEEEVEARPARDCRLLTPTSTFDSFLLWNPDGPVDRGEDVYLRGLEEWTTLASIVSPPLPLVKRVQSH